MAGLDAAAKLIGSCTVVEPLLSYAASTRHHTEQHSYGAEVQPLASLLPSSLSRKRPWIGQVPGLLLCISDPIAHVHSLSYADFTAALLFFGADFSVHYLYYFSCTL